VADPDQAFGGQSNRGHQNVLTYLNTKVVFDNRWVSQKCVYLI